MHTSEWSFKSTFFSSTCPLLFHSQDMSFIRSNGHFPQSQHMSAPWNESHPSIHPFSLIIRTYHTIHSWSASHVIHITTIYFLRLACSINKSAHGETPQSLLLYPFPPFFLFLPWTFNPEPFSTCEKELYPYRTEKSWVIFKFEIYYLGAHYFRWPFGSPSAFRSFS